MKILAFESLDSTSSFALRQLESGAETLPFAVVAKSQTAGRGRSGRSWESPEGGLYLTLVLPADRHPLPDHRGALPLWVAAHVAAFIHATFGIRITIKWPNDLLFAGRKLAGILCESRLHGNDWGPVIIGIGINLHEAPDVAEQSSISVRGILGPDRAIDALRLGTDLCRFLESRLQDADWLKVYQAYALEKGQLWKGEGGPLRSLKAVTSDGSLVLSGVGQDSAETLNTASHGYRWIYQLDDGLPLIVADIGNSLCKLAYYENARRGEAKLLKIDLRDHDHKEHLATFLETLNHPKPWVAHGIAVATRPWEKLSELLRPHQIELVEVPKRPLRVDFSGYHFNQLGSDRVALSEAARHRFRDVPVLVVSAGTCITVEALSSKGLYLGGYILPGLQTKLNSLHLRTERLPLLKIYEEKLPEDLPLFGHDTRGAMLSGIIHEAVALVEYLIRELAKAEEAGSGGVGGAKAPRVLLTGGDGEILGRFISGDYCSDLVIEGVRLIALGGQI